MNRRTRIFLRLPRWMRGFTLRRYQLIRPMGSPALNSSLSAQATVWALAEAVERQRLPHLH